MLLSQQRDAGKLSTGAVEAGGQRLQLGDDATLFRLAKEGVASKAKTKAGVTRVLPR